MPSQYGVVTGPGFSLPNQPDQVRTTAYHDSSGSDSRSDAHSAIIVDDREEPSGESRLKGLEKNMTTGTVKWFNTVKGYGFLQPEDGDKDAFVHISAVESAGLTGLREGQKVEFELVPGKDGKSSAENLVALD